MWGYVDAMQEEEEKEAGGRRSSCCRHFHQTGQTGRLEDKPKTSQPDQP